jgi:hypothetical protein
LTGAGAAGAVVAVGVAVVFGATFFTCFLVFFEVTAGFAAVVLLAGGGTCFANIVGSAATASAIVNKVVFMAFFSWRASARLQFHIAL